MTSNTNQMAWDQIAKVAREHLAAQRKREATSFVVTKEFTGGVLHGLTINETTPVRFEVGFVCDKPSGGSPYKVIACKPVV
jgi:F0F1-type ATP synthase assembly protein I